jgi:hypothetical protein
MMATDSQFLPLQSVIPQLIETKTRFYFYLAGVDILASDKLGLGYIEGCKKREQWFLNSSNTKSCTSFYGRWLFSRY